MKEFMLIFRNEKRPSDALPSAEQMQAMMSQWQKWIRNFAEQGKYSASNRLHPEGKTVSPGAVVTDGPYLESKEMIGGYLIVKADSLDEAVEAAKSCPNLLYGGNVEVRAVMAIDSDAKSGTFLHEKEAVLS
ncbi:MAG TPA: YciI family protein [Chitinophagaceae bacterium]|nr:YciI family protein [Chitinophagaceae bacterium]